LLDIATFAPICEAYRSRDAAPNKPRRDALGRTTPASNDRPVKPVPRRTGFVFLSPASSRIVIVRFRLALT
jgi:hypothetical protein